MVRQCILDLVKLRRSNQGSRSAHWLEELGARLVPHSRQTCDFSNCGLVNGHVNVLFAVGVDF